MPLRGYRDPDCDAIIVRASALAQAFFDGAKQAQLSRLIEQPYIAVAPLDRTAAKQIGPLRNSTRHDDVVDVHVAWLAKVHDLAIVTSDGKDMGRLGIAKDRLVEV